MGYYSRARGEIEFSPDLPMYAVKGNALIYKYISGEFDVRLDADGSYISAPEDSFKAYWIKEQLTELVDEIIKINPNTQFVGAIEIEGEGDGSGQPDIWRLKVKDGKVIEISPTLVWPED